ncbi:hypothetical protein L6164_019296 [Bauhinia variegata]|uniref:Uncharacterized protein n=1 Tax=Bauhinia variegata TaxID=167791 RepID=A0ACB9NF68_BAUVA|nr:hypothetical protein L6164_019296 [Bauhinia variegata]
MMMAPESLLSLTCNHFRHWCLLKGVMCPESILWLKYSVVKLTGRFGRSPWNWLSLTSDVLSCRNPVRSGILPQKALLDELKWVKLRNSEILAGLGPENLFSEKSRN